MYSKKLRSQSSLFLVLVIFGAIIWSLAGTNTSPLILISRDGLFQLIDFFRSMYPPKFGLGTILFAVGKSIETLSMSLLGTILAMIIGFPLSFVAAENLSSKGILFAIDKRNPFLRNVRKIIQILATLILNLLRSIPEILWALIFILMAGLGPFPGVLALGFHTGGILGKLYSEVIEEVNTESLEPLISVGSGTIGFIAYGVIPQALPQMLSYTLYRWEVNIRAAAIVGVVGAGGLGKEIFTSISLFQYNRLLTYLIMLLIIVSAVDFFSAWLRKRFI